MKKLILLMLVFLSACATVKESDKTVYIGQIINIRTFTQPEQINPTGAVLGGLGGAVIGSQMGKGRGKTAMTILGGLGGAVIGSQIGKGQEQVTELTIAIQNQDKIITVKVKENDFNLKQRVRLIQYGDTVNIERL